MVLQYSNLFKLPSYEVMKNASTNLQNNLIANVNFSEALEQLSSTNEFETD